MFQSSICHFMQFFCSIWTDVWTYLLLWSRWSFSCSVFIHKRIWILLSFLSFKSEVHLCIVLALFLVAAFCYLLWYLSGDCSMLFLLGSSNFGELVKRLRLFRVQLFDIEEHVFELSLWKLRMTLVLGLPWMTDRTILGRCSTVPVQYLI